MSRRANQTGRTSRDSKHVRLYRWMLETAAWKDLTVCDRAVYLEFAARYHGPGSGNGRIPMSVRELAMALGIGKSSAATSIKRLIERGFIVCTKEGTFQWKDRRASEYRLTEYPCDITGQIATKEFARWSPQKQNTVRPENHTVPEGGHIGTPARTVGHLKLAHGT